VGCGGRQQRPCQIRQSYLSKAQKCWLPRLSGKPPRAHDRGECRLCNSTRSARTARSCKYGCPTPRGAFGCAAGQKSRCTGRLVPAWRRKPRCNSLGPGTRAGRNRKLYPCSTRPPATLVQGVLWPAFRTQPPQSFPRPGNLHSLKATRGREWRTPIGAMTKILDDIFLSPATAIV